MLKKVWGMLKSIFEHISKVMPNIVNFILLSLVYALGIGIVSIFMKLLGNHFLQLKKQNKVSNWVEHKVTKQPLEQYYKTF